MKILTILLILAVTPLFAQVRFTDCYLINCDENPEDYKHVKFGYIMVPENHAYPGGRTLYVAFFLVKTTNPNPKPDPVIFVQGGWGSPDVYGACGYAKSYPHLKNRDLIVMDPRGIGFSKPEISPEIAFEFGDDFLSAFSYEELKKRQVERQKKCLESLDFDFELYSTKHRASDYIALMKALNYTSHGISYGTRAIQDILRQDQTMIRSVVIDSNVPVAHIKHGKYIDYYYRTLSLILSKNELDDFEQFLAGMGDTNLEIPIADSIAYINRQE
jgi:pimeloyl-ACP methyl ester carboxylesterase